MLTVALDPQDTKGERDIVLWLMEQCRDEMHGKHCSSVEVLIQMK